MAKNIGWSPRSRQKEGELTERKIVKERGGRVHPRSGAGSIKWDGSSDEEVMEIKDANITHTLNGQMLDDLFRKAMKLGKSPVYIVQFKKHKIKAVITLERY